MAEKENNESIEEILSDEDIKNKNILKRQEVDREIDNNPYLQPLRTVLNDKQFRAVSGISRETIIDSYLSYDSNLNRAIDINYILMNAISVIKQVSEDPNGYVYNLDGTQNEELSEEQRREYNLGEYNKIREAEKKLEDNLYELIKNGDLKNDITKSIFITQKSLSYEDKIQHAAEKYVGENEEKTKYTNLRNDNDIKLVALSYIAISLKEETKGFREISDKEAKVLGLKSGARVTENDVLKLLQKQTKSKYFKEILGEDKNISLENLEQFRQKWERQRNDQATEDKLFQLMESKNNDISDLELPIRQKTLGYIYRAVSSGNPETIELAKKVALKLKIEIFKEDLDKNKYQDANNMKIDKRKLKSCLCSLSPKDTTSKEDTEKFLAMCAGYGLENLEKVFEKLSLIQDDIKINGGKDRGDESGEDIRNRRRMSKYYNYCKESFLKEKRKEKKVFKELKKIGFKGRKEQQRLVKYYMDIKGKDPDKAKIIENFMFSNTQYFGKVINNGEEINEKQVKKFLRGNNELDYSEIEEAMEKAESESSIKKAIETGKKDLRSLYDKKIKIKKMPVGQYKKVGKSKETDERRYINEVVGKIDFSAKINEVSFMALYAKMKYIDESDPNISENEKQINQKICKEMLSVIKNEESFSMYLENGEVQKNRAVMAIQEYQNNKRAKGSRDISDSELAKSINEYKEEKYGIKQHEKQKDTNIEKSKGVIENIRDFVNDIFNKEDSKEERGGIKDRIASVIEKGKKIVGNIKDGIQKAISARNALLLPEGVRVKESANSIVLSKQQQESLNNQNTEIGIEGASDFKNTETSGKSWELPKEEVEKINQNSRLVVGSHVKTTSNVKKDGAEVNFDEVIGG